MTDEEVKIKQTAFLVETVAFYSQDPDRLRSQVGFSPNGTSPGCAIGRHLDPELAKFLDNSTGYRELELSGPPELISMGLRFIKAMMFFHDCKDYWTSTGLSLEGRRRVNEIQLQINNGDFKNRWYD